MGNVWEWTESPWVMQIICLILSRAQRGGAYSGSSGYLRLFGVEAPGHMTRVQFMASVLPLFQNGLRDFTDGRRWIIKVWQKKTVARNSGKATAWQAGTVALLAVGR